MSIFDERPSDVRAELQAARVAPRHGHRARPSPWTASIDDIRRQPMPLTQDQTNAAIRFEIWMRMEPADRETFVTFLGYQPSSWFVQRGGIDEDEVIRWLAYRMWGRRDMDHGVKIDGSTLSGMRANHLIVDDPHDMTIDRNGDLVPIALTDISLSSDLRSFRNRMRYGIATTQRPTLVSISGR